MALTAERQKHYVGELRQIINAAAAGLDGRLVDPTTLPKDVLEGDPEVLHVMLSGGDMSLFSVRDAYFAAQDALYDQMMQEGGTNDDFERVALTAHGKLEQNGPR